LFEIIKGKVTDVNQASDLKFTKVMIDHLLVLVRRV